MFTEKMIVRVPTENIKVRHFHPEPPNPEQSPDHIVINPLGCDTWLKPMGDGRAGISTCGDLLYFSYEKGAE